MNKPTDTDNSQAAILAAAFYIAFSAAAHAAFPGVMATSYGADPSGVADSSAAINACLREAGPGGVCWATGGKFRLLGDVFIPANTTLSCGASYPGRDNYTGYASAPALLPDSSHSIKGAGDGWKLSNCLVYRDGMTFPPPDASQFFGVAVDDRGWANSTVTDTEIIGFDTCLWIRGLRPYVARTLSDCAGNKMAAVEWDVGNTDSGYFLHSRINPLNGTGTCQSLRRPGVGLRMGGSGGPGALVDGIVVQGFDTYQYDFEGASLTEVGQIWADNPIGACGPPSKSVGVLIGPSASIHANHVYISAQWAGMISLGNGAETSIGTILSINAATVGLLLGDPNHSGNVDSFLTSIADVSGPAIWVGHINPGYHSERTVLSRTGGIQSNVPLSAEQFSIRSLQQGQ
jgi:hypothetical protein